jgi:hypothetical protein
MNLKFLIRLLRSLRKLQLPSALHIYLVHAKVNYCILLSEPRCLNSVAFRPFNLETPLRSTSLPPRLTQSKVHQAKTLAASPRQTKRRVLPESIAHFLFDPSVRSESDLAQVEYTYKFPLFFVHFLLRASCAINYPKEKNHFITGGGVYPHTQNTTGTRGTQKAADDATASVLAQPHLDQKEDVGLSLSPFSIVTHKAMLFWRLEQ